MNDHRTSETKMECTVCRAARTMRLDADQIQALDVTGACPLYCESCRRDTFWVHADHVRRSNRERRANCERRAMARAGQQPQSADRRRSVSDRRMARSNRRAPLALPVRVRYANGQRTEEVTVTSNVSRKGLYFHTAKAFEVGQDVRVALNYSSMSPGEALEQPGLVVRIDGAPGGERRGVAVKYV
jgi:hypothetical protein